MRPRLVRMLVAVISTAALLVQPSAVAGSLPCQGFVSNWFDGIHTSSAYSTYGAFAYITTNVGATCTGSQGTSAAWTMVADNFYSGASGYAQSGYAKTSTTASRYFSQWRRSGAYVATTVWGASATGTPTFRTYYWTTTHRLRMWVGNAMLDETNFDPIAAWVQPFDSQYFGETWKPQDDMPGTSGNHAKFTTVRYLSTSSCCNWIPLPSAVGVVTGSSRYHLSAPNTDHFDIWTDPLQ